MITSTVRIVKRYTYIKCRVVVVVIHPNEEVLIEAAVVAAAVICHAETILQVAGFHHSLIILLIIGTDIQEVVAEITDFQAQGIMMIIESLIDRIGNPTIETITIVHQIENA